MEQLKDGAAFLAKVRELLDRARELIPTATHDVTVSLADGIAVKRVGEMTFPIVRELVDEVVLVEEEEIVEVIASHYTEAYSSAPDG